MEIPVDASRRLRSATPTRPPRFSLTTTTRMRTLADLDRAVDRIGGVAGVERTLTSIILSTRLSR